MEKWQIISLAVFSFIILIYFVYLFISFFFMSSFNKKINIQNKTLSLLIFQKAKILYTLNDLLDKYILNNEKINLFFNEKKYLEYKDYDVKEIKNINIEIDDIYKEFKTILINNKIESYKEVSSEFNLYDDLNKRFFITSQIYNSNVVGYNYWRNLKLTKFIKVIFKIKEKETII